MVRGEGKFYKYVFQQSLLLLPTFFNVARYDPMLIPLV